MQDGDQIYIPLNGANEEDRDSINTVCDILKQFAAKGVEETLPTVSLVTFFHGMEISFVEGEYISIYRAVGAKLALGSGEGGNTVVLNDLQAVQDFERLKVLPTKLTIRPNPAHFGETLHFIGNNGDPGESTPFIVSWAPIVDHYSSSDTDPS
ncbi:hypothetical protein BVG16_15290 [Paenibacillus selenitireducens]|uniref:Uncharacterized protein n=1 Tax=Paenibacillus selenitireducens TaxID=1324314 RepID=A0A1T2XD23_9BACL|nr:hypothetical protein [Paenibacillus selenitireducens]OPA77789.1 hypothetical protein BVG16_15290 [Paenibacillus selenitireducens]